MRELALKRECICSILLSVDLLLLRASALVLVCEKMPLTDEEYFSFLTSNGIVVLSPPEMAKDYMESHLEWYHLTLNDSDFYLFFRLAPVKLYGICRCRPRSEPESPDKITHLHALIRFIGPASLWTFKKNLRQTGMHVNKKTRFEKINCLDQACVVLDCISCDGFSTALPKQGEGFHSTPHTHYSRIVSDQSWLHKMGHGCSIAKDKFIKVTTEGLCDTSKSSSLTTLHDSEPCPCQIRHLPKEKRTDVKSNRRAFDSGVKSLRLKTNKFVNMREKEKLIVRLRTLLCNCENAEIVNAELIRLTVNELIKL